MRSIANLGLLPSYMYNKYELSQLVSLCFKTHKMYFNLL